MLSFPSPHLFPFSINILKKFDLRENLFNAAFCSSTHSISVCPLPHFSFLLLSRVKKPGSLPSACLWNLWAEPRYALGMLKLNASPLPLPLSPFGFGNACAEHCFPAKQVASSGAHVGGLGWNLVDGQDRKETNLISILLSSPSPLLKCIQITAIQVGKPGTTIVLQMKTQIKGKIYLHDENISYWSKRPYPYVGTNNHHQIISGSFDMPHRWWTIVITPHSGAPGQGSIFKHTTCYENKREFISRKI